MITDRDKLDRIMRKIREIVEEELTDNYTGEFGLTMKFQNGGVNGKVAVAKEK